MKIHKRTLDNGLRVLIAQKESLESVSIVIGVNFGSVDVGRNHEGLAHYLEHMLFKGTKKRSWSQINGITRKYNIFYNAETDYETTMYEAQVYKRYTENAMELISDMIKHPKFSRKEFKHELGPIVHEIAMRKEDPNSIVYDNMPRALFKESKEIIPESISSLEHNISLQNIIDAYETYYNPGNSVLVISGGIDEESGIRLAKEYMGEFERKFSSPKRDRLFLNKNIKRINMKRKGTERGEVAIGFGCHGINSSELQEYVSMRAIASILNNRIYDQIREIHGLSYDPSVEYNAYSTFGYISASAGGSPSKLNRIRKLMLQEFQKLKNGKIEREELENVKRGLEIKYALDTDDTLETATKITEMELMYGDGRMYGKMPGMIKRLNADSLERIASSYISMKRYGMITLSRE